jgi:hypothetical protein
MFAVSAAMQGSLLVMCFVWKVRQRRLSIDDFGLPLSRLPDAVSEAVNDEGGILPEAPVNGTIGPDNGEGDEDGDGVEARRANVSEQTPLLERTQSGTLHGKGIQEVRKPWWKRLF